jgi:CDP-diacylglycerol--glycerol-3-phosphate 3-phosphatidyltransferase
MAVTTVRFFVAPIIFTVLLLDLSWSYWAATILFILGSITDWLDGFLARKLNAESNMGKFMDPIADKILVLSTLIILLYYRRVDPFTPAILLARDIFIGGVRSVAAADGVIIAAKTSGKWKTGLQMVAIPCLFIDFEILNFTVHQIGTWILWLSVLFSIYSGAEYTLGFFRGAKVK